MSKKYLDDKCHLVAAVHGLGDKFIVARIAPNGSRKRIKSPLLPPRLHLETAQTDLDGYADAKGWKAFSEPEPLPIKVWALVDCMGSLGKSDEEEYQEIRSDIEAVHGMKVAFKTGKHPWMLAQQKVDAYIIDYGGLLPGSDDGIRSTYRSLLEQIQEKPNTLFVLYSAFTQRWYLGVMEATAPELKAPNVLYRNDDDFEDKWRAWFTL